MSQRSSTVRLLKHAPWQMGVPVLFLFFMAGCGQDVNSITTLNGRSSQTLSSPTSTGSCGSSDIFSGGDGSSGSPYLIATVCDLVNLAASATNWTSHFQMVNNIDLTGVTFNPSIDNFTGVFDGNGNTISNWTASNSLFSYSSGTIKNLTLSNVVMDLITITRAGLLLGVNDVSGTVTNCTVSGTITHWLTEALIVGGLVGDNLGSVTHSNADVSITAYDGVGGLVGWNTGTITASFAAGSITANNSSNTLGVGGLAGGNAGTIFNSYSQVSVSGSSCVGGLVGQNTAVVKDSYSSGQVAGSGTNVGGLIGQNAAAGTMITSAYWDTQASGAGSSSAGTGETTASMETSATFSGWDFTNVWTIASGYPTLR